MDKLIDYICDELDEMEEKVGRGGKLSASEVEYGDMLAHFKKNLLTGEAMMDEGYSGDWHDGMDGRSYRGRSYARGGRGSGARRNSMGRYSSRYYSGDEIDAETKKDIKRLADKLDSM